MSKPTPALRLARTRVYTDRRSAGPMARFKDMHASMPAMCMQSMQACMQACGEAHGVCTTVDRWSALAAAAHGTPTVAPRAGALWAETDQTQADERAG
eukprot:8556807-Karenia_brevis.AAC.1